MRFVDLTVAGAPEIHGAAQVLLETFSALGNPTWTTLHAAEQEVSDCLQEGYVAQAVLSDEGHVVAWGGLRPTVAVRRKRCHVVTFVLVRAIRLLRISICNRFSMLAKLVSGS